jgi:hypothetical protein
MFFMFILGEHPWILAVDPNRDIPTPTKGKPQFAQFECHNLPITTTETTPWNPTLVGSFRFFKRVACCAKSLGSKATYFQFEP